MKKILIVDDSLFMRRVLTEIISSDPDLEVVSTAINGKMAIEQIPRFKPDCITLDFEMPEMDGLTTLKYIMQNFPTPVIMLSSFTYEGAKVTLEALNEGAVDFIHKPAGRTPEDFEAMADELIDKIKIVSNVGSDKLSRRIQFTDKITKSAEEKIISGESAKRIIAIGISTGGPSALNYVLSKIKKDLKAGILITQHMPKGFTKELANVLDRISPLTVKEAEGDEIINNGNVFVAPGEIHLGVKKDGLNNYRILLDEKTPPVLGHRPSAEVLFSTVAEACGSNSMGIIMTGMGGDGAKNLGMIKDANGMTIAQDEASCVVYGMPKVAVDEGNVIKVLSLDEIAFEINKFGS